MRVKVRQKNLKITPAFEIYLEQKLLKPLRRMLRGELGHELPILDLEFYRRTRHHRKGKVYHVEANLSLNGRMIRAAVDEEDPRAACDILEEKLEREIGKFKGKASARYKRGARKAKKDLRYSPLAGFQRKGRIRDE